VINVRSLLLKVVATALSLAATAASAAYVTSHVKNPAAPMQPPVLASTSISPTDAPPVTSTYAS
jgi:hypothetical protein